MKAISPITRQKIKAYLEVFIEHLVKEHKGRKIPALGAPAEYLAQESEAGQLKPFHIAIVPTELLRIAEFERSLSTKLGTTFEECARLIALDHHDEAHRSYDIKGQVSAAALNEIERQVAVFEHAAKYGARRPTLRQMIQAVLAVRRKDDLIQRSARADLYILTKDGKRLFFEIKSPVPNKGQCLEVTQRILRFHLFYGKSRPSVQAYFGNGL